jgi:lycopene cyclase domain-containing protein
MKSLYLWLNLGSFLIPFLFSFHPKIQFYKKWKSVFIGIAVMMLIFIPWDILFTQKGFWGFNESYLTGYYLFHLPIEEWLFFICIPYACVFTHYTLLKLTPKFVLPVRTSHIVYYLLICILVIALWYQYDGWYTFINFLYAIILLGITFNYQRQILPSFMATYVVILIPFFVVNGVLTGSFIGEPVVWYNDAENLGIRLGTIPIEDIIYNLGMLLTVILVTEWLEQIKRPTKKSND